MNPNTVMTSAIQAPPAPVNTTISQASRNFRTEKKHPNGSNAVSARLVSQDLVCAHIPSFVAVWTQFSEIEKNALSQIFSSNPNTISAKTHTFVYSSSKGTLSDRVTKPLAKDPAREAERAARKAIKVEKRKTMRAQKNKAKATIQRVQANADEVLATVQEPVLQQPKVEAKVEEDFGLTLDI